MNLNLILFCVYFTQTLNIPAPSDIEQDNRLQPAKRKLTVTTVKPKKKLPIYTVYVSRIMQAARIASHLWFCTICGVIKFNKTLKTFCRCLTG